MTLKQIIDNLFEKMAQIDELRAENSDLIIENDEMKESIKTLRSELDLTRMQLEFFKKENIANSKVVDDMRKASKKAISLMGLAMVLIAIAGVISLFWC